MALAEAIAAVVASGSPTPWDWHINLWVTAQCGKPPSGASAHQHSQVSGKPTAMVWRALPPTTRTLNTPSAACVQLDTDDTLQQVFHTKEKWSSDASIILLFDAERVYVEK